MAEFEFAEWVARARAFMAEIGTVPGVEVHSAIVTAPIGDSDLQTIERALGTGVPTSLRALFTRGAGTLDCAYVFEPQGQALDELRSLCDETRVFGGAALSPAAELADNLNNVRLWARDTWIADEPDERRIWESALPFLRLRNGDFVALDRRVTEADPPVAYLCHDDESFQLAPDLVAFLTAWERLCYIGPEHWLLRPFTDDAGQLDADNERAARLRALLGR